MDPSVKTSGAHLRPADEVGGISLFLLIIIGVLGLWLTTVTVALEEKRVINHQARQVLLRGNQLLSDYHEDLYERYGLIAFLDLGTVKERLGHTDEKPLDYEVEKTLFDGGILYDQMVLFAKGKLVVEGIDLITEPGALSTVAEGTEEVDKWQSQEKDLERLQRVQESVDRDKKRYNDHLEKGDVHKLAPLAQGFHRDADRLQEQLNRIEDKELARSLDLEGEIKELRQKAHALEQGELDSGTLTPFDLEEEEPGEPFRFSFDPLGVTGQRLTESDLPSDRRPSAGEASLVSRPVFHEYLLGIFATRYSSDQRSFDFTGRREDDPVLEEEVGYLLFGLDSDLKNDLALKGALFTQRLAVNALWIVKDPVMYKQLMLFSGKLGAGNPVATALIFAASLTGLSSYESALEIPELLDGKGLKMVKHQGDFRFSVKNLMVERVEPEGEGEVFYHDHLRLLLFAVPRRTLLSRAMDLMEVDFRRRIGLGFRIEEFVTTFSLSLERQEGRYEKRFGY